MNFPRNNFDAENLCNQCKAKQPPNESNAIGLIDDIMEKYFCRKLGQGSSCSLFRRPKGSVYSMDKRLDYWNRILEDRKRIACRIQKATGKRLSHVLYNQTEEYRRVQNVKRVIDAAERLHPTNLAKRKTESIKETLFETLPLSERLQKQSLLVVGTPKVTMAEQCLHGDGDNPFLKSSYLQRKLKKAVEGEGNALEFYPDIGDLEVTGHRISKHPRPFAEVISDYELSVVSTVSGCGSWEGQEFPEYSLQVNETILRGDAKLSEALVVEANFNCMLFTTVTQTVCRVKNLGKKPLILHIRRVKPKGAAYLPSFKKVFHFNVNSVRLGYAETAEVEVTFCSDERRGYEEHYCVMIEPSFLEETHKIILKLIGDCYLPQNYFKAMIDDLLDTAIHSAIPGSVCARKLLTDKELFEEQNPGFACEPQDLRKFCEIYRQVRRKHHPVRWNMNLQTLKELIEGVLDYDQRTAYLEIFTRTIQEMRRRSPNVNPNLNILLARTVIVASIDKWEKKARQIRHSVATKDIDLLIIKMASDTVMERIQLCKNDREKRRIILLEALFIQMFCCLCDLAEDIVSFVENCLKLYTL